MSGTLIPVKDLPELIAERTGLRPHMATVRRWLRVPVKGRQLRGTLVGGRCFVRASDLEDFLNTPMRGAEGRR